jgi:hypothetical protein
MVGARGTVEAKNPLRYAPSLSGQSYSWIDVRPKGKAFLLVPSDPLIENSGSNLKAVEVGYRRNAGDDYTYVSFYRTREEAQAAALAAKKRVEDDAKTDAEMKASNAKWEQRLMSLPYMVANRDAGFKVVYAVCKPAAKNAKGENTCNNEGSHDWSDNPAVPYRWRAQ